MRREDLRQQRGPHVVAGLRGRVATLLQPAVRLAAAAEVAPHQDERYAQEQEQNQKHERNEQQNTAPIPHPAVSLVSHSAVSLVPHSAVSLVSPHVSKCHLLHLIGS